MSAIHGNGGEYSDNSMVGGGRMSNMPNGNNGPDARSQSFHSGRGNGATAKGIMDAKK